MNLSIFIHWTFTVFFLKLSYHFPIFYIELVTYKISYNQFISKFFLSFEFFVGILLCRVHHHHSSLVFMFVVSSRLLNLGNNLLQKSITILPFVKFLISVFIMEFLHSFWFSNYLEKYFRYLNIIFLRCIGYPVSWHLFYLHKRWLRRFPYSAYSVPVLDLKSFPSQNMKLTICVFK